MVVPLGRRGRPLAEVQLRVEPDSPLFVPDRACPPVLPGRPGPTWSPSATALAARLDGDAAAAPGRRGRGAPSSRRAKLDALAEFAAGAGHELNNPLAVIVGRAQLFWPRADDPGTVRSLRAIIAQAQRAHRILRDLMYVARPPSPAPPLPARGDRPRLRCRDLKAEAEARGVRLVAEAREPAPRSGPTPTRSATCAESCSATPWRRPRRRHRPIHRPSGDVGRTGLDRRATAAGGSTADEGPHLFDPFYCGRQAGPRAGPGPAPGRSDRRTAGGGLTWRWPSAAGNRPSRSRSRSRAAHRRR